MPYSNIDIVTLKRAFQDSPGEVKLSRPNSKTYKRYKIISSSFDDDTYFNPGAIYIGRYDFVSKMRKIEIHTHNGLTLRKSVSLLLPENEKIEFYLSKNRLSNDESFAFEQFLFLKVVGCDNSIVKMTDLNGKSFWVVKGDSVIKGGMATIKVAHVFSDDGQPVAKPLVVRTAGAPNPPFVEDQQLDFAIARAERVKRLKSQRPVGRHYSLLNMGLCSLRDYLDEFHSTPGFSLDSMFEIATVVVYLISKLHRQDIAHCDIKPDNILLHADERRISRISIIDWDFAVQGVDAYPSLGRSGGTPGYFLNKAGSFRQRDLFALLHTLADIFTKPVLVNNRELKNLFYSSENRIKAEYPDPRLSDFILCATLFAKNNLLAFFYNGTTTFFYHDLTECVLSYEDENSRWLWLANSDVKEIIEQISKQAAPVNALRTLLNNMIADRKIKLKEIGANKNDFSMPINLPLPAALYKNRCGLFELGKPNEKPKTENNFHCAAM